MRTVGIMEDCDYVTTQSIERGFTAGIGNLGDPRIVRPGSSTIEAFGFIKFPAECIGPDYHRDSSITKFYDIVFCPTVVTVIGSQTNVSVFGPRFPRVAADQNPVARITDIVEKCLVPRFSLRGRWRRPGGRPLIVLEGHDDSAIARDNVVPNKCEPGQTSRHRFRLRPGSAIVITLNHPRLPITTPRLRVSAEKKSAALADGHEFSRTLPDGLAGAGQTNVYRGEGRPRLAKIDTAGYADVIPWGRLEVIPCQHEQGPRAIRQFTEGRIAHKLVGRYPIVWNALTVMLRVLGGLPQPCCTRTDGRRKLHGSAGRRPIRVGGTRRRGLREANNSRHDSKDKTQHPLGRGCKRYKAWDWFHKVRRHATA